MEKSRDPPPYTPPPHAHYQQPPPPGPGTAGSAGDISVTTATVVVGSTTQFGPAGQSLVCPHCRSQIISRVDAETTSKTHLIAVLLCVCLCWCCVCLPYCMDSCKNKNHYCPSCGAFLGTYAG